MTFIIETFQSHCKSEQNEVKWNKITPDMCKFDSIFFIYKLKRRVTFDIYFLIRFI